MNDEETLKTLLAMSVHRAARAEARLEFLALVLEVCGEYSTDGRKLVRILCKGPELKKPTNTDEEPTAG